MARKIKRKLAHTVAKKQSVVRRSVPFFSLRKLHSLFYKNSSFRFFIIACILGVAILIYRQVSAVEQLCVVSEPALSASTATPLNDWGGGEYQRLTSIDPVQTYQATGYIDSGGLYNGSNSRPPTHEAAGIEIAVNDVKPRNASGALDPTGKIGLLTMGMSNTKMESASFLQIANSEGSKSTSVVLVNGADGDMTSNVWADVNNPIWEYAKNKVAAKNMTPQQVQVVWIKNTRKFVSTFPERPQEVQADLYQVVQNVTHHFPNARLAYLSSRTHPYRYFEDLNPEPEAYENGFSVKWLIQQQIAGGDPNLNYDPDAGLVKAPWLSWGPYLWIDRAHIRGDGFTWNPEDLIGDCTHPSYSGKTKVANMLVNFFKSDTTTAPWYLKPGVPTPTVTPIPTDTPIVTPTPVGETTPSPTLANTPTPTQPVVPTPTKTPRPTRTPSPTP